MLAVNASGSGKVSLDAALRHWGVARGAFVLDGEVCAEELRDLQHAGLRGTDGLGLQLVVA